MRIDVAYCVELEQVIDIHKACQEFANQDKHIAFKFLCSDSTCRHSKPDGVKISAVNHYKVPKERKISPHFRQADDHIPTCYWVELNEALNESSVSLELEEISEQQKSLLKKTKRLITRFAIKDKIEVDDNKAIHLALENIKKDVNLHSRKKKLLSYLKERGSSTTSFEALVSCYEELKQAKALNVKFFMVGHGLISFQKAFRQIAYGVVPEAFIYQGGARLSKRYGSGFLLNFIDKIDSIPASFYVSSNHLKDYRPSSQLKRLIDELEANSAKRPYVRVYWIGGFEKSEKCYNAIFKSLAYVAFRIVYPTSNV